jgi:hypothetical protein
MNKTSMDGPFEESRSTTAFAQVYCVDGEDHKDFALWPCGPIMSVVKFFPPLLDSCLGWKFLLLVREASGPCKGPENRGF